MRSLTILFVFISFQISLAQDYIPFPDSNAIWTGNKIDVTCGDPLYICYFDQIITSGDTIIGAYSYNKLYRTVNGGNYYYSGGLRNDVPGKKVYYVKASTAIDSLLYDFSLEIGDSLAASYINYNDYPAPWTVISIDSVLSTGQYRKRFNISNTGWETSIIEGIGHEGGLLEHLFYPEGWSDLLCFFQNDSLEYPTGNVNMEMCHLVHETPNCADTTYLPTITTSAPLTICQGDTILLEAESGYDAYLWSTGDTTQSISVSDSGDYSVSALVDTCWFGSDTVEINVSDPQPYILDNGDTLFCFPSFTSYQWYLNGEPITGANEQIYCMTQTGNYEVYVTDDWGCVGISSVIEIGWAKTNSTCFLNVDEDNRTSFKIYPNPASTTITLEFPASANFKTAELSIQTITGQVVNELLINNEKLTIDVEHFSKGLYIFKVRAGDEVVVRKVVVE